jgi:hypothetical protein
MLLIYTSVRKKIGSKDLRNPAGPAFMVTKILGQARSAHHLLRLALESTKFREASQP